MSGAWFRDALTDGDGKYEFVRGGVFASLLVGLSLAVSGHFDGKPFDFQAFGIGVGALLGGAGLGALAKGRAL